MANEEGKRPRWPLLITPENRGTSVNTDSRLLNCYVEIQQDKQVWVYKRPGLTPWAHSISGTQGMGIYNWLNDIYSIVDGTVYKNGVALTGSVDTTGGTYTFSSTLGATPSLLLNNGVKMYYYNSTVGSVTTITDPNLEPNLVKGSAYLDGTTYVMNKKANVQGSHINDLTTWAADNIIVAQIEPDDGVCVGKQLVYVIAFKEWSTEVFYDAGNATGSPLGSVQGAKLNEGCRHQDTVRYLEGAIFWVSQNREGGTSIWYMDSVKAQSVSSPPIDRLLQNLDYTTIYSWTAKIGGHRFYGVTSVVTNITIVHDLSTHMWSQWTDTNGNYLPWVSSTFLNGQTLIQLVNGSVFTLDINNFTDNGSGFSVEIITPNWDGGVRNRKTVPLMDVITDQVSGSELEIRCSDDDYKSWTNWRRVDLSIKRPVLPFMGTFRRRAMHLRHRKPTAFRIQALEFDVLVGSL